MEYLLLPRESSFTHFMPYRRTDNVVRRLAAREQTILEAATEMAAEGGMGKVQIADVAKRAGIAAGTVYRYFPSKTDLVAELVAAVAGRELDAMKAAAAATNSATRSVFDGK